MKIYRHFEEQKLPVSIQEAWDFFSSPGNLSKITPPEMKFIITNDPGKNIYSGQVITYKVRPLFNIPLNWVTIISAVEKPYYFIDEQKFGPYKFWHHRHTFKELSDGVLMKDEVYYALPAGVLGRMMHRFFIKKKIEEIFSFRKETFKKMFL
jgi:ligand-binding SRPBCC domain-containing protein